MREQDPIEVIWDDKSYHAVIRNIVEQADFALLQILEEELNDIHTPALAIFAGQGREFTYHSAVTMGYAGLENRDLLLAKRMFMGQIGKTRLKGSQERIEFVDLGVGKGNSGAPVFDLQLFRVIGYIRSVTSKTQRLGDGLSMQHLVRLRGDLLPVWEEAGQKVDRMVVSHYRSTGQLFELSQLSPGITLALLNQHNRNLINSFRMNDIYIPELYQRREIQ
ncbi:MAG TPA: hypothetical protein VJ508_12735, partial [Saprospiraceae bacterium]|nr:hypothetical protein [Saprospiraceae bacterium]